MGYEHFPRSAQDTFLEVWWELAIVGHMEKCVCDAFILLSMVDGIVFKCPDCRYIFLH